MSDNFFESLSESLREFTKEFDYLDELVQELRRHAKALTEVDANHIHLLTPAQADAWRFIHDVASGKR